MKKIFIYTSILFIFCITYLLYRHFSAPTVSVILATYNRENLLPRSIESILNQTFKDFELIIVDDGSTDKTEPLIRRYMINDSRIKLIQLKENKGVSYARNIGIENARGKYIAITDSDDQSLPNRFEKQVRILKENQTYTALSGHVLDYNHKLTSHDFLKWDTYTPVKNSFDLSFLFSNTFSNAAAMIRHDFIKEHNIRYDESYIAAEDYDFWKQIILAGGKLLTVYEPFTFIRYHESNSKKYYNEMIRVSTQIHGELMSRFFTPTEKDVKFSYTLDEKCTILNKVLEGNKTTKILKEEEILNYKKDYCPTDIDESYFIKEGNKQDYIVKKGDSYFKWLSKEPVGFNKKEDVLTITENGKKTLYKKHPQKAGYYFFTPNNLKLKHAGWEDFLLQKDTNNNHFCRFETEECATITKKENTLILKWDNPYYKNETFVFDKQKNIYIKK